jgi:hypothetical protein
MVPKRKSRLREIIFGKRSPKRGVLVRELSWDIIPKSFIAYGDFEYQGRIPRRRKLSIGCSQAFYSFGRAQV